MNVNDLANKLKSAKKEETAASKQQRKKTAKNEETAGSKQQRRRQQRK